MTDGALLWKAVRGIGATLGKRARAVHAKGRRPVLTASGFGLMATSAYHVNTGVGLLVTGVAVLAFEWLGGGDT